MSTIVKIANIILIVAPVVGLVSLSHEPEILGSFLNVLFIATLVFVGLELLFAGEVGLAMFIVVTAAALRAIYCVFNGDFVVDVAFLVAATSIAGLVYSSD